MFDIESLKFKRKSHSDIADCNLLNLWLNVKIKKYFVP